MKRIVFYIMILAVMLLIPEQGMDIGKLLPVELIYVYTEDGQVIIETDTRNLGQGQTLQEAFQNLEDTTAGVIYLDTADYLLISEDAQPLIKQLQEYVKPEVWVCCCNERAELSEAAAFLAVHKPESKLKDVVESGNIGQELKTEGERNILKKVGKRY